MESIQLVIDLKNMPIPYPFITCNRDYYSSDLSYESYMNYIKQMNGRGGVDTLLEDLAGGAVKSGFDAVNQVLFNRTMEKLANNAVKKAVKANPDLIWED